ncbi:hypothetical protein [Fluviicola taffensis]|uniref:Uncharacterized protein n=1 Tax=Fluviicola taffensis (strain DSM 16823 / NCIMB 13979 / RW262) TaxID=755732 RepID=F2I9G8_FLUTR|nr:hypothetical protein [Fluviicola taffensis]AEA45149.1 hypothetical protein Fluta_3175 [Fluviicola taffensis DSM 16823]
MDKESNHTMVKILHSGKVMRATSSNAFGCFLVMAFLAVVWTVVLSVKSFVNKTPFSTIEQTTIYLSIVIVVIFVVITIRLRLRSEFALTVGKSDDGKIVITVNDPKKPITIEGPFQIDCFYFKKIAHTKPIKIMTHLRLVVKKKDKCYIVMHETYEDFKSSPIGWQEIDFNEQFERCGDVEDRYVDYVVTEEDKRICEGLIDIFTLEVDEIEALYLE